MVMTMIKMIVGQLKLVAALEGEPFGGAFGKKTQINRRNTRTHTHTRKETNIQTEHDGKTWTEPFDRGRRSPGT